MAWMNSIIEKIKSLEEGKRRLVLCGAIAGVIVILVIILGVAVLLHKSPQQNKKNETEANVVADPEQTEQEEQSQGSEEDIAMDKEDPQTQTGGNMSQESGASVNLSDVISQANGNETGEITFGIDVSKYQGTIDWKKVAESGVDFVMVRVGYRTQKTGEIIADTNAKYNMQEAQKYGIKVGAYFFSTAITEAEAMEEANWVADYISKYKITYPVAYNCEGYEDTNNRQNTLSKTQRTNMALTFLKTIRGRGYTPMFYGAKNEIEGEAKWETSRISSTYKIWVAQYPSVPYPQTTASSYSGTHAMWQYTNAGSVPGISKPVDVNIAYFGYEQVENAKDNETPEEVGADVEALMKFTEVNEMVTAKDKTNLRDKPSQGDDSKVMYTLSNGEIATRTGISNSGWSRIVFNGQTYYAVSSYLTTDLSYKPPSAEEPEEPEDGIRTTFVDVNERVTAKEVVNLRTLPSVTNPDSQVVAQLKNGEVIVRTGINYELGWSRVEYNGQILYCVSSYLMLVE